jgi:octaprenyl-diphosphate synthase
MSATLADHYHEHLRRIDAVVLHELDEWSWCHIPQMEQLVRAQVERGGKRLRPLLALAMVDVFEGTYARAIGPCAAVEMFHLASLILDDIQDNSEVRRGTRAVHTTSGTSTALNLAGTLRTLSYHPLHRQHDLGAEEKLHVHRRLDTAATQLFMGQTIDIGWHEGWYEDSGTFPYQQMIEWKTGSLFACASWIGAFVAGANPDMVERADGFGVRIGAFYQLLDDYLDIFADGEVLARPKFEDLRGGKLTRPVSLLIQRLNTEGRSEVAVRVVEAMRDHRHGVTDANWMTGLMHECGVGDILAGDLRSRAEELVELAARLSPGGSLPAGLDLYLTSLFRHVPGWTQPRAAATS